MKAPDGGYAMASVITLKKNCTKSTRNLFTRQFIFLERFFYHLKGAGVGEITPSGVTAADPEELLDAKFIR